jgi:sulfate permease, SulP family
MHPIRHDTGSTTARSVDEIALIRDTVRPLSGCVDRTKFVAPYLRSDMDRHGITAAIGEARIFTTLHEAVAAVRGVGLETRPEQ